jgi:hypothetical protein
MRLFERGNGVRLLCNRPRSGILRAAGEYFERHGAAMLGATVRPFRAVDFACSAGSEPLRQAVGSKGGARSSYHVRLLPLRATKIVPDEGSALGGVAV